MQVKVGQKPARLLWFVGDDESHLSQDLGRPEGSILRGRKRRADHEKSAHIEPQVTGLL